MCDFKGQRVLEEGGFRHSGGSVKPTYNQVQK